MDRKIIKKHLSNEKAFTLIEVIVSLVLAGIMAAVVGLGLVKIAQSYIFAKQNSETVQKAQIAMTRIVKELGAAEPSGTSTAITAAGTTAVSYKRREPIGSSTFISNTISINPIPSSSNGQVQMNGATLINNVVTGSSSFAYFDAAGNITATLAKIRRIDITLSVTGAENQITNFNNSVWINESY
jgi:prepilin-type N-terminal cleavage/methylation domain-containing protein